VRSPSRLQSMRLPLPPSLVATAPFYLTARPAESDPATFSSDLTHLVLCWLKSSGSGTSRRIASDSQIAEHLKIARGAPGHHLVAGAAGEHAAVDAAGVLPGHRGGLRHLVCCGGCGGSMWPAWLAITRATVQRCGRGVLDRVYGAEGTTVHPRSVG
jgi:hypothetical protein